MADVYKRQTVKQRGIDFINCLVDFYNLDANDEKNEVAQKSAEFIDERIGIINRELGTAETELADFKQRSGLTDLTSEDVYKRQLFAYCYILVDIRTLSSFSLILKNLFAITSI